MESECFPKLKIVKADMICPSIKNSTGFEYLESIGESACFNDLLSDEGFKDLNRIGNSNKKCDFIFKNLIKVTNLKHVKLLGNNESTSVFNESVENDIKNLILPGKTTITYSRNIITKKIKLTYLRLIGRFQKKFGTVKENPYTNDMTKKR